MLNLMCTNEVNPNTVTFTGIMGVLCRKGEVEKALKLYDVMTGRGLKPNDYTCSILVGGLCRTKRLDDAVNLFKKMVLNGYASVVCLNTLLHGFLELGRREEATKLFKENLFFKETMADVVTHNTLMDGFCKTGDLMAAKKLLHDMKVRGLVPSLVSYNTLVSGLCKRGDIDRALDLVEYAVNNGQMPDVITYSTLLDGLCKVGRFQVAENLLNQMHENRIEVDVVTYSTILNGYCKTGQLQKAQIILGQMSKRGVHPNGVTYKALFEGLCLKGETQEAFKVVHEMVALRIAPSSHAISLFPDSNVISGQVGKMSGLLSFLHEGQEKEDDQAYSDFLDVMVVQVNNYRKMNCYSQLKVLSWEYLTAGICRKHHFLRKRPRIFENLKTVPSFPMIPITELLWVSDGPMLGYKSLPGGQSGNGQLKLRSDEEVSVIEIVYWTDLMLLVPGLGGIPWHSDNLQKLGSVEYWVLYSLLRIIASKRKQDRYWKVHQLFFYCRVGILACMGGLLGLGGHFSLGSLFLELGVHPQGEQLVTADFYFLVSATNAAFVGQHIVRKLVALLGRASLIIFILTLSIFVSAISVGGVGIWKFGREGGT
ncbi:hypothetical protein H6P81_000226 [Aristolochia fimbriata]|uniref:Pentatricopeptide repeat-containing protein n=1 Tax=Aristolochia fimbriata TaxID=158543 RepID=A0AAV7F815_ARIFI|nr:hypothetical protein H6P81_000226 [Aristolochia fimbriata]